MNIVWIGCHEEGLLAFEKVLEDGYCVSAFITLNEETFSKRSGGSRGYKAICEQYCVDYHMVSTIKNEESHQIIDNYKPDLLVVLGWSEILPEYLLKIPTIGTVGTHAALLPHNRGSAPINWAIIKGEKKTGNTLMWLSKQVDAGEIIDQMEFPITLYDTCKTLYEKVAKTNAIMLVRLISNLNNGIKPSIEIENDTNEEILPRRRPKDGLISWEKSSLEVYNFIRALTEPYPGAFTYLNSKKYFVWKAAYLSTFDNSIPGTIIGHSYGFSENSCGIIVQTGDGCILITEIEDCNGNRYYGEKLNELELQGVFRNE